MIYPATYDITLLQNSTFRMQVTATDSGGTAINLSGYTIDSDIVSTIDREQVATFACTVTNAASGIFELFMSPAVSSGIEAGQYDYDISATEGNGDRYYWVKGKATVESTASRN